MTSITGPATAPVKKTTNQKTKAHIRRTSEMKKNEMAILIEGLRRLSADVLQIAEALEGKPEEAPVTAAEAAPSESTAKEETKTYSLEEVRRILADKSRSGYRAEVKALLTAHGASRLSDITDPAALSALALEAEVIGNG